MFFCSRKSWFVFSTGSFAWIFLLLILVVAKDCFADKKTSARQKVHIFFRYDDVSAISNTGLEKELLRIFSSYGVELAIAIIPAVTHAGLLMDTIKTEMIKDAVFCRIFHPLMHGTNHRINAAGRGEFAGESYLFQKQQIEYGKKQLEELLGFPIYGFVPPWNEYDENTVKVLENLSFNLLSAGVMFGQEPYISNLKYLPATSTLQQLQSNVAKALGSSDPSPIVVVLMHEYDFIRDSKGRFDLTVLKETLGWIQNNEDLITPTWSSLQIAEIDLSLDRLAFNRKLYRDQKMVPPFLRSADADIFLRGVYFNVGFEPAPSEWKRRLKVVLFFLMVLFLSFLFLLFILSLFAVRKKKYTRGFLNIVFVVFLLSVVYLHLREASGGWVVYSILVFQLGAIAAGVVAFRKAKSLN